MITSKLLKFTHLALFFTLAGLVACQQNRVFEEYRHIDDARWAYKDTLTFSVPIRDTLKNYGLFVNLRNKINYPYRNLWVLIEHRSPSGQISSVKAELTLADKSGKWKGQGLGDLYDHRKPIRKKLRIRETGMHQFRITHLMRTDTLKGIMNFGMQLRKSQS